jgi:hypothetical protein
MRPAFGQLLVHWGLAEVAHSADDPTHTRWFAPGSPSDIERSHEVLPWAKCDLLVSGVSTGADAWSEHARAALRANPEGRLICFEPRPPTGYRGHVSAFHREQLAAAGVRLAEPDRKNAAGLPSRDRGIATIAPGNSNDVPAQRRGPVFIHPGSGGVAKCWPLNGFVAVGRRLRGCGRPVRFVLGEAELERWSAADLGNLAAEFEVWRQPDLLELADVLAGASGYLGNDSGVTHLAAATGVPTLALFGPSDPVQWRPLGPHVRVLQAPMPERMASLTVEAVRAALLDSDLREDGSA